jgi:preprotein translocase subunit SecB
MRRRGGVMSRKYVKHLTLEELAERLADELVDTHNDTGIDLGYWETALELVERFYEVDVKVTIKNKRSSK